MGKSREGDMAARQFPREELVDWLATSGERVLLAFDDLELSRTSGFNPTFTLQYLYGYSRHNYHIEIGLRKGKRAAGVFRKQALNLKNVRLALDSVIADTRSAVLFDNLRRV